MIHVENTSPLGLVTIGTDTDGWPCLYDAEGEIVARGGNEAELREAAYRHGWPLAAPDDDDGE